MKTKSLTYSFGETVNTGNFNSVRVEFSITVDLEEGDDPNKIFIDLQQQVTSRVHAAAAKHKK